MANADIQAQRDALAMVVAKVWANAREGYEFDAPEVEALMTKVGLAELWVATKDDPENDIEIGDDLIRLTKLGLAALAVVEPP